MQQLAANGALEALLDAAVDAVVMIDAEGGIVGFNRAAERMFGYEQKDVIGKRVNMLMPEPYRSEHDGYMQRYLDTGHKRIIGTGREAQARHSDGRVFPIWLSVGEATGGGTRRFVGIIRDLSQQRAAEEERLSLEARLTHVGRFSLMGEMAAGIAHEINQPLTAIATYAQAAQRLLDKPALDEEALKRACAAIATQVHRAGQVIENLRSFIRKRDIEKKSLDLNAVVSDAMTLVLADANRAGIPVSTSLKGKLPRTYGNAVQIQQVLLNLTHNAVDAMQGSPHRGDGIHIRTWAEESGEVALEVSDRGCGVEPSVAQCLFDPFVTTKPEGLGVGLAISRTIVLSHGGRLAYTQNPEGGAIFTVVLPAETEDGR